MTFEELVKKLTPKLKGITHKLNGRFTFFNDEDLFQEALINLWQDFRDGTLDDKTDSYILQGCYFHLKNYIRMQKLRTPLVSLEVAAGDEEGLSLKDTLWLQDERSKYYFDYLNDKLLADAIHNNGFTKREKAVLIFCAEGLTTRAIGKRLGVSHVMVVKLISRIRGKCKKYLEK
ncbi:MAG: sigma-70 family RNA polymerase sigma factor [Candidatus Omnitrophota bacterium]